MSTSIEQTYELVCRHVRETTLLVACESALGWDERTMLPPAATEYRADQLAYLAGLIHRRRVDRELGKWLEELAASPLAADRHSVVGTNIRELKRTYDRATQLPQTLVEELSRTASLGQHVWEQARKNNDYASFAPILKKMYHLKRAQADAYGWQECRYDALLDDYEPGERTANLTHVLLRLRDALIPLVATLAARDRTLDTSMLHRRFPIDRQVQFGRTVAEAIGFNFNRGRLDVTAHPFCTNLGPNDTRLTTRYDEHNLSSALFSTLHEAGHGIYDQGLPGDQYGLPAGEAISLGIHESQSRMWENLVGRSAAFWRNFFPQAQATFAESLGDVTAKQFHAAVNEVRPSLIRTEADETTYNLHILIRFELEQALLNEELSVEELPGVWRDKYHGYLGIQPPDDRDGCLQDVHWSAGLIGYFPTYTLGNLYAAQFFAAADRDLGGVHAQFERGEFSPLKDWLAERIHRHGQCYSAAELVEQVTGAPLSHEPLIQHLKTLGT